MQGLPGSAECFRFHEWTMLKKEMRYYNNRVMSFYLFDCIFHVTLTCSSLETQPLEEKKNLFLLAFFFKTCKSQVKYVLHAEAATVGTQILSWVLVYIRLIKPFPVMLCLWQSLHLKISLSLAVFLRWKKSDVLGYLICSRRKTACHIKSLQCENLIHPQGQHLCYTALVRKLNEDSLLFGVNVHSFFFFTGW